MARRRRRNSPLETPSNAGEITTAMLLYEAPSGIAVFSFDLRYLNGISKVFWKYLPSLSLEVFIKSKMVPSPIDFANKSVDSLLADSLIELCGSEKTLFVGSAEHKRIIETTLGITCMYVDVPDCEMIICHLKDHVRNLLGFPDDASAMLLHEAPSGIAIFSFDESYLNGLAKDFWACLPPLRLVEFMAYERVPTPIDLDNEAIDDRLTKRLMKLCGSEKKLVVGSAAHKRIIEMKVEKITCLYVDILDCEVIICSLKEPMGTLLPDEEKADPVKNIISFLHQHDFDIPGGKLMKQMLHFIEVEESYYAPALRLHEVKLCEKNYLKFFRLLLNKFLSRSGIDTKTWILIQFATALKMICHPRASYEVHHPDEIFLLDVYSKIVDHSPGYKGGFLKIDVLSLYNEVLSLCSQRSRHLYKLDALVRKAAKMKAKLEEHPCVEVPNGFCKEIYNSESKSKEAAEQTGKLDADNSVLCSGVGGLDATSTLLEDKESEAAVRHDSVRPLEDEATTRLIDVAFDPAEKEAPDLSVVMKKDNENDGLLAKLNHLEALALEVRKASEEAKKAVQLNHKLVDVLMEKVNENGGLLEKVNHLEAQLLIAKKASEEAKVETPCQLEDKPLHRYSAVATGIETETGNVGGWGRHWRSLGLSLSSSRPQSSNVGSSSRKMSHNKVGGRSRSTVQRWVRSICCYSAR